MFLEHPLTLLDHPQIAGRCRTLQPRSHRTVLVMGDEFRQNRDLSGRLLLKCALQVKILAFLKVIEGRLGLFLDIYLLNLLEVKA